MASYTQASRLMTITTPLGKDALLLVGFQGREAISELFQFELELLATKETTIAFDKIIGQAITVKLALPGGGSRFFNGIVRRFTQSRRDEVFTHFRAEMVPQLWLLTRKVQSRIFQHVAVPEILKQVLTGLNVTYEIQGEYHPRDYCVQYRESDFAFVSRLMEEEGIYYFFKHSDGGHQLVVTDVADQHPDLPGQSRIVYQEELGGGREDLRITEWEKSQELRSGQYTLWDHCFELPGKNLEARRAIVESVPVGKVTHKLKVGGNEKLEIYDYPGAYAQRFDGMDRAGAQQADDLQKIFKDNERTVKIRMEQEALPSLEVTGASNCPHFVPGHQFTLTRHFDADGPYLLTGVRHSARLGGNYRSGQDVSLEYQNEFRAIPAALPYRPQRITPPATVSGTQTATVVGPPGEKVFCDRYGRVKVQFHWDRQGKKNLDSSCWLRVAQAWAGGGFGAVAIPRVGDEVIVDFLEGDPDQPIIVGCVYNFDKMPPFTLPEHRMFSGIKSNSVEGHPGKNFSGLSFNDTTGNERVALYSEKNMMVNSENNLAHHVGNYSHAQVGRTSLTTVGGIPGIGPGGGDGGSGSGGGGSGGGGGGPESDYSGTQIDPTTGKPTPLPPMKKPGFGDWSISNQKLGAALGLAGITVYGVNQQDTVGFMHQVTVGAAYQICINPLGFFGWVDSVAASPGLGFLSAIGGNVQLCWGANTQAVYGPAISINHGPQMTITAKPSTPTKIFATLVPCCAVLYELFYAAMGINSRADAAAAAWGVMALGYTSLLVLSEAMDRSIKSAEDLATLTAATGLLKATLTAVDSPLDQPLVETLVNQQEAHVKALKDRPYTPDDSAPDITLVDGPFIRMANHIHLIGRQAPDSKDPSPTTIYINAFGKIGDDGTVLINGGKGVSITSGGGYIGLHGNEVIDSELALKCPPLGKITLTNNPGKTEEMQQVQLDQTSIKMKFGPFGTATFDLAKGIELKYGPSSLKMDQTGITMEGLILKSNGKVQVEEMSLIKKIKSQLASWAITLLNQQ
jgi:type VI secretion system secreted protein VgrG